MSSKEEQRDLPSISAEEARLASQRIYDRVQTAVQDLAVKVPRGDDRAEYVRMLPDHRRPAYPDEILDES